MTFCKGMCRSTPYVLCHAPCLYVHTLYLELHSLPVPDVKFSIVNRGTYVDPTLLVYF